ncbi:hypothetical protein J5226_19415 [Lysobacter sp. K5869]|uniref:hypothetical protein n=1 Tax=Lysobacter sp. K5869 TaxID=2820808 RepID=UPI001C062EBF|nr:hypothetical protein [Lysobacter sp. K5869]QWP75756.1 hypothetical protein J5226_19415 [Lysobacter sp. K5869]
MRAAAIACGFAALLLQGGCAAAGDYRELALPQASRPGERLYLEVRLGALAPGQELQVSDARGRSLGTVSPYGVRAGNGGGTFVLPVPADAVRAGRLRVRLSVTRAGAPAREPASDEVEALRLVQAPGD